MSLDEGSAAESVTYKGSMESSLNKGSEELFEYGCDLCNTAGGHEEAQGFCDSCDEYLCDSCFKHHSRGKVTRNHTLLDRNRMPRKHRACDTCRTAGEDKDAEGYCTTCEEYLCIGCFKSHSRSKATRSHVMMDKDSLPEAYTFVKDVCIKDKKDKEDCLITDMVLVSNGWLVVADDRNKSLKLIDIENNVCKATLGIGKFSKFPLRITAISEDELIFITENYQLRVISISGTLFTQHRNIPAEMSIREGYRYEVPCVAVTNVGEKVFVLEDVMEIMLYVLDTKHNKVVNQSRLTSELKKNCSLPTSIAVNNDGSLIYVSSTKTNKVMCIDMNGSMVSMYKGELNEPCDISVSPSGSVYLCNRNQHVVYKMTPDLSEATMILGQGDGLVLPQAMCFNADKQHLYISTASEEAKYRNFIKVYKWM